MNNIGCVYCRENNNNNFILIDEVLKINDIIALSFDNKIDMTWGELDSFNESVFVYIDRGYLRLSGPDCDCLDHGEKIKINFCPFCGRRL